MASSGSYPLGQAHVKSREKTPGAAARWGREGRCCQEREGKGAAAGRQEEGSGEELWGGAQASLSQELTMLLPSPMKLICGAAVG